MELKRFSANLAAEIGDKAADLAPELCPLGVPNRDA